MSELSEAHIADLQHMLPSGHWDISGSWNPKLYQSSTAQYLSKAYWDMLDAKVTSREHWNPISLDLSFGHSLGQPKPESMVELYNEMQKLTTVTTLRIRELFHSVDLWDNLAPHWLSMRHLSLEFRHECPQLFFKCLSQMSRLEVLQLEFLVVPKEKRIKLDLTTSLRALSLGFPTIIPVEDGFSLDRVELGVMPDLQELILYAPIVVKRAVKRTQSQRQSVPPMEVQKDQALPDWMYTLPQFTCLEKLEWHYITYTYFCALGPYLPTSLTDLKLTHQNDNDEQDIAHNDRIYGEDPEVQPILDNFPNNFDMKPVAGSFLKLTHLRTANLPVFVWKYHHFTEILPQMTSLLDLDLRNCHLRVYQGSMLDILSEMTQLTCLKMWTSGPYEAPANIALQRLTRLEWLSPLSPSSDLDTTRLIWPALKYVYLDWTEQWHPDDSEPPKWPPLMQFLQHHTSLQDLTLTVSYQIAAKDQFWSVLSQLTLLTALECMIDRAMPYEKGDTLKVPILPPALKRLVWEGCVLMIPYDHLALENVKLVVYNRDTGERGDADIRAFCRRNRVRNRTLEEYVAPLDIDSLVHHWFVDDLASFV